MTHGYLPSENSRKYLPSQFPLAAIRGHLKSHSDFGTIGTIDVTLEQSERETLRLYLPMTP
jgi:hypothetical protein